MRKTILILIFLTTQFYILGQNYNTTLGIKLSPGIATIYNSVLKQSNYCRFSTTFGLEVKQRLFKDKLYLESGLNLIDRGIKIHAHLTDQYGNDLGISKAKAINYYLLLPISLTFQYKGFFVGADQISIFIWQGDLLLTENLSAQKDYIGKKVFFSAHNSF